MRVMHIFFGILIGCVCFILLVYCSSQMTKASECRESAVILTERTISCQEFPNARLVIETYIGQIVAHCVCPSAPDGNAQRSQTLTDHVAAEHVGGDPK